MAKIQSVDYLDLPKKARDMRQKGQKLNSEMTNAYKLIDDMHKDWYGKRYNSLLTEFNNLTPQINEMLKLVVTDIPFAIETVANNYSQADRGQNAGSAQQTSCKKISNIATKNDTGMKFITSSVENTKKQVETKFKNAKTAMNEINSIFSKVNWNSEAATAFKTKFSKLKQNIDTSLDNILHSFTTLMQQAANDIASAEKANTVS